MYTELGVYPCTDEDLAEFYAPEKRIEKRLEEFSVLPDRQLYCVDFSDHGLDLQGTVESGIYSMLEISIVPCGMDLTVIQFEDPRINPECVHEWKEMVNK